MKNYENTIEQIIKESQYGFPAITSDHIQQFFDILYEYLECGHISLHRYAEVLNIIQNHNWDNVRDGLGKRLDDPPRSLGEFGVTIFNSTKKQRKHIEELSLDKKILCDYFVCKSIEFIDHGIDNKGRLILNSKDRDFQKSDYILKHDGQYTNLEHKANPIGRDDNSNFEAHYKKEDLEKCIDTNSIVLTIFESFNEIRYVSFMNVEQMKYIINNKVAKIQYTKNGNLFCGGKPSFKLNSKEIYLSSKVYPFN